MTYTDRLTIRLGIATLTASILVCYYCYHCFILVVSYSMNINTTMNKYKI